MDMLFNDPRVNKIKASELAYWLLSRGISTITTDEIATLLSIPKNQVPQRLASPKKRGEIVLLANGLWVPVPPDYKTWGAPPAIDVIDALMRHKNADYYVGWLSAAALHGASHHAPQVFQVAVSHAIREKDFGRSRLRFYQRNHVNLIKKASFETKSGYALVSTREMTLLDIACDISAVGGIDNAANLIIELVEASSPDFDVLLDISKHYPTSAIRRLGYLMEQFTGASSLGRLQSISEERKAAISSLDPQSANAGPIDKHWQLRINKEVSPDV